MTFFSNRFSARSAHRLDFIHAFGYATRAETRQRVGGGVSYRFHLLLLIFFFSPNEIFQQTANVLLQLN